LIAAPLYVITTTTLDHEEGLKTLVEAVDAIRTSIKNAGGEFTEKAAVSLSFHHRLQGPVPRKRDNSLS